jgi:hypothetical protein
LGEAQHGSCGVDAAVVDTRHGCLDERLAAQSQSVITYELRVRQRCTRASGSAAHLIEELVETNDLLDHRVQGQKALKSTDHRPEASDVLLREGEQPLPRSSVQLPG